MFQGFEHWNDGGVVCDGDPCISFAALPAIGDYPG